MRASFGQFDFSHLEKASHLAHFANELPDFQHIFNAQVPLVSIKEINKLRQLTAKAAIGEHFLIQSFDYIDNFFEYDEDATYTKLDFMQQLADFFEKKTGYKVIQVQTIPRAQDPLRILLNYNCSVSLFQEINQWNQGMKSVCKVYTSGEVLPPYYKSALNHLDKQTGAYYNRSIHFPMLDARLGSGIHSINYLKKIANPIAVRIGSNTSIKHLVKIINELDPDHIPGRITLVPGLGAKQVLSILPQLIDAVKKTQRTVLWSCDPMYGNTETIGLGVKIRKISKIVEELKNSFLIHRQMGSRLNAVYFATTCEAVTECLDYEFSSSNLVIDFKKNYKYPTEIRLNYEQTMHVLQQITKGYLAQL